MIPKFNSSTDPIAFIVSESPTNGGCAESYVTAGAKWYSPFKGEWAQFGFVVVTSKEAVLDYDRLAAWKSKILSRIGLFTYAHYLPFRWLRHLVTDFLIPDV